MDQVYLFGLSSQRSSWLSNRQTVVAENVANANTPGFAGKDLKPFSEVLDATHLEMAGDSPMHLAAFGGRPSSTEIVDETPWDVMHSGNTVSLEQEMMKAGEISRGYALNTSVAKSFHRMLLMNVKI